FASSPLRAAAPSSWRRSRPAGCAWAWRSAPPSPPRRWNGSVVLACTRSATMPNRSRQHCGQPFTYRAPDIRAQLRYHRLIVGDSTREEDVARAMGGQKAALMATDPPYLVGYHGGNHPQSWSNQPDVRNKHWDDYHEGEASELFFQFLAWALEIALVS